MQQGFLHRKDSPTVDENLNAMTCNTSGAALSNFSNFHTASIDQMCKISDSVPSDYTACTPPALTSALQIREPDVPAPDFYEDDIIRMYSRKAQHQILHVHSGAGTPEDKYMSRISEYQDSKVEPALISKLESILATGRRKQKCPRHNNPGPYSREDLEYFDLQGTCSLVSFIFDTGASISISDVSLNKFLHNDTRSTVSISGFHGDGTVHGDLHGSLNCFPVLSKCEADLRKSGMVYANKSIEVEVDTASGVNNPLLSFTKFFESMGYNLQIVQQLPDVDPMHNLNFCGMYRRDPDDPSVWSDKIPFRYDWRRHQWTVEFAVAQSAAHAKRFATIVSARRLRDNASAKMLSDCASVPHQHLSLVQSLFTAPVLVNSNAPKVSPELELKLSKLMAETKVLADGYTPTPSDIDSLRKKIAELQSTVDLDDCELEDGDLRSLNIGKFARATQKQLHEMLGHYGKCRGCIHCMQIKKSLGVVVKRPRAKHDPRPGHTVDMDVVYWSFMGLSRRGYKYTVVMKDRCTGTMFCFHVTTRDEIPSAFLDFVMNLRGDSRFDQDGYSIFHRINLDLAGEFVGADFQAVLKQLNITQVQFKDPFEKRDNAHAEFAVQQLELQIKKQMGATSSPADYICYHADHACKLMSRLPLSRNVHSVSGDGIRPLEELTHGKISRRDCDTDLLHMVTPGQLILASDKSTKGSDVSATRCVWGVALGTKDASQLGSQIDPGHLTVIENPYTGVQRATKTFFVPTLAPGQSAWDVLGTTPPSAIVDSSLPRMGDKSFPAITIVKLPLTLEPMQPNASITGMQMHNSPLSGQPSIRMYDMLGRLLITDPATGLLHTGQIALPDVLQQLGVSDKPHIEFHSAEYQQRVLQDHPKQFIGRKVYQYFDIDTDPPGIYEGTVVSYQCTTGSGQLWRVHYDAVGNNNACTCDYDFDEMMSYCVNADSTNVITSENIDSLVQDQQSKYLPVEDFEFYTCKSKDTFAKVCTKISLPAPDRRLYYDWLCQTFGYGPQSSEHPDAIHFESPFVSNTDNKLKPAGPQFKAKTKFPIPAGYTWLDLKNQANCASNSLNPVFQNVQTVNRLIDATAEASRMKYKDTSPLLPAINSGGYTVPGSHHQTKFKHHALSTGLVQSLLDTDNPLWASALMMSDSETLELSTLISKYVPNNAYVDPTGKIKPPTSLADAQTRSDWPLWEWAYAKERSSFARLGVHSEAMTLAECRKQYNITTTPVRSHWIFDTKYSVKTDEFLKAKGRWVVDGTPAQMKLNQHYFEFYSPAPNPIATRLMNSIACAYAKRRYAADIDTAFLHSVLADHERIIVRLPEGMWTTNAKGEQCAYVVLLRGQYGTRPAAFYWSRTRDEWLMKRFSQSPFTIKKLMLEQCMFIITNTDTNTKTHMLVHVDDMDVIADADADVKIIFEAMNDEWGLTISDPDMMLGVQRTVTEKDGERFLEMHMPNFVTDWYNEWAFKMEAAGTPMKKSAPATPFPEGEQFSVIGTEAFPRPSDAEILEVQHDLQKFTGQGLWVSRMVMPDLLFACSQHGRIASAGSKKVLTDVSTQMLRYAYSQRHRGIRFRSNGCKTLRASYDASDNPDPKDGKSMYGYSICLFDGPIVAVSKKSSKVGTSSTHNEFMALGEVAKAGVYISDLLVEMEFPECVDPEGMPAAGDNQTATSQLGENRITERNRFYLTDMHYVREIYELGRLRPHWVMGAQNGADIYTKAVSRQVLLQLRDKETGYSDDPLPPPNMTLTPLDAVTAKLICFCCKQSM